MTTAWAATHEARQAETTWTNTQAYALAVFCLLLGVALGYLFRGSASPSAVTMAGNNASALSQGGGQSQPTAAQQKAMVEQVAAPLLAALESNPGDYDSIVKLGNIYYDGQLYPQAIEYYERALKIRPNDPDVITDMGTAYWYTNDADRALAEFQRSLKIRPDHAGTLFNIGIVRWQGKNDPAGAVAAWEELLKRNPNYPQKQQVEEIIVKAKQHASGKPSAS
ncbi:MAG TPA: tetratricopeptide repeat protein [Terriglobales bacterium]|jgi:cytochrome c-type biogenesis protein CcmH/NrfG